MTLSTLGQIIEDVHDGGRPDYDDLRYALVAMTALRGFDNRALLALARAKRENQKPIITRDPEYQARESHERYRRALEKPPKEYVGPEHDPDTEECQRMRRLAKNVMRKVCGDGG